MLKMMVHLTLVAFQMGPDHMLWSIKRNRIILLSMLLEDQDLDVHKIHI